MSYLFDSSAILKEFTEDRIEALAGNFTLQLAPYELGNALWTEHRLKGHLDLNEVLSTTLLLKRILATMKQLTIDCHEQDIARVASKLKLTFYDASYAFQAHENTLPLVSEDNELRRKTKSYVTSFNVDELTAQT